jgi:hypothetical protein
MNTLAYQRDSRESLNRARPACDGPMPAEPSAPLASAPTEVQPNHSATNAPVLQRTTSSRWLGSDDNGSHLVNFPFAFTVFMIMTTGLIVVGWGITVTAAWLTVVGFLITLLGCALYGWSLYDD